MWKTRECFHPCSDVSGEGGTRKENLGQKQANEPIKKKAKKQTT